MLTFYDSSGRPVAYIDDDGGSVYLFDGTPIAWLSEGAVYDYSGQYLGWYKDGWVYDRDGHPAFFTEDAVGGPIRPIRHVTPVRAVKHVRPVRSIPEIRPVRPIRSMSWSDLSGDQFFEQ